MARTDDKIEIENINTPGRISRVDKKKYTSMRRALLKVIPEREPGMSAMDLKEMLLPHLSDDLFPGGEKAGWWLKAVQLDLEAKGLVTRANTRPLTFYKKLS